MANLQLIAKTEIENVPSIAMTKRSFFEGPSILVSLSYIYQLPVNLNSNSSYP
jgi:hypothetical protein